MQKLSVFLIVNVSHLSSIGHTVFSIKFYFSITLVAYFNDGSFSLFLAINDLMVFCAIEIKCRKKESFSSYAYLEKEIINLKNMRHPKGGWRNFFKEQKFNAKEIKIVFRLK